ncbi:MAG: extracellular solute-binding protein [Patescibacteria group bacterium]|jgi:ABC-type glycerol-3-phosphate transport system substrate-binding protein
MIIQLFKSLRVRFSIISLLLLAVVLTGASCTSKPPVTAKPITLKIWRVFDEEDTFSQIISGYQATHPNVTIEYKKLRFEEFRDELLSAWSRGEGPDIFSIPNYQVGEFRDFMKPLPESLTIPRRVTKKVLGVKEETSYVNEKTKTYSINDIKSKFVPTVYEDVVFNDADAKERVYGLPLAIDSLALYYNRGILNKAGIPLPPATWRELLNQVPKLVKESSSGELVQSAIALGAADNVPRYVDILSTLMMQDGATMNQGDKSATFQANFAASAKTDTESNFKPGPHALQFFTDFANPAKQAYSWNTDLPDAYEAFIQGQLAYFIGYSYQAPLIKTAAPTLDFDIAPLPQVSLDQSVNFANYWVESVYTKSDNSDWAWDFITYATKKEQVVGYLNQVMRPSALREVILLQSEQDEAIKVFTDQALDSTSWYHGRDYAKVEEVFKNMIEDVTNNRATAEQAVSAAEKTINQNENLKK